VYHFYRFINPFSFSPNCCFKNEEKENNFLFIDFQTCPLLSGCDPTKAFLHKIAFKSQCCDQFFRISIKFSNLHFPTLSLSLSCLNKRAMMAAVLVAVMHKQAYEKERSFFIRKVLNNYRYLLIAELKARMNAHAIREKGDILNSILESEREELNV
jgi:hypothetical protein